MIKQYSQFHQNMKLLMEKWGSSAALADIYSLSLYDPKEEPRPWQREEIMNHLVIYGTAVYNAKEQYNA